MEHNRKIVVVGFQKMFQRAVPLCGGGLEVRGRDRRIALEEGSVCRREAVPHCRNFLEAVAATYFSSVSGRLKG